MTTIPTSAAAQTALLPASDPDAQAGTATSVLAAAGVLLPHLEGGQRIDAALLRGAMEAAFGGSHATGAWSWKTAYDACEVAVVLFLRKYGRAMFGQADDPAAILLQIAKLSRLLPTQTRRSEASQSFQQFSTPIPLGFAAATAAAITPADRVLEPSAGTGLLAILAEIAGGTLLLNELAETRASLLSSLFPALSVTRFDAAQIHDHLDPSLVPTVVLMNPPFSALAHVEGRVADAAFRHIGSAFARLAPGGRLVTITGAGLAPDNPAWTAAWRRLQERGRVVFSAAIDGAVYAPHGTTTPTRLTVIDKRPADDPAAFPGSPGMAPDVATLLAWFADKLPVRLLVEPGLTQPIASAVPRAGTRHATQAPVTCAGPAAPVPVFPEPQGALLSYETVDWEPSEADRLSDTLYEDYALQTIRIAGAEAHPTPLVQSAAMASVAPPRPGYRPTLPTDIRARLSEAQLETVILAGEAHGSFLAGAWTVDDTFDRLAAAPEEATEAVRFRQGFMIGDGTGVGKGREAAAIILDNWLQGRRKAVWISKSDKLIEDAQRDWQAMGMERLLVTPLSRFAQGVTITLNEGILFLTYATLRSDERGEKPSRVKQVVEWLGPDHDGVVIFDEAHAMANAAGGRGERGDAAPSQQGRAGLRLQHALPNARVVYVSATGATTVHNLAYAQRLGLWGGEDFPFSTRTEFVEAIEAGGVAALEVLARDLRALGLYTARSLSFKGVEYELVRHDLTPEQVRIYDSYAEAFSIIHNDLDAAMQAANITGASGTLRRNRPVTLEAALAELDDPRAKLLVNERSGRSAVQVPTTSVMLDDGEIERRVRLIRPMEAQNLAVRMMGATHWIEADQESFASGWKAELAEVPEFTESTLHMVTGLLLPIWKRLPDDSTRVYRLQTDAGERIIGRKVSPAWAANATTTCIAPITPDDAFAALMEGRTILELAEGLPLRRVRVMGTHRIELSGFTDAMRPRLTAGGLFSEIISWTLRMFVPLDASGPAVLERLLGRWTVLRIHEREGA